MRQIRYLVTVSKGISSGRAIFSKKKNKLFHLKVTLFKKIPVEEFRMFAALFSQEL